MAYITVTLEIEIPYGTTNKDIKDFVDVEFAGVGEMKLDNPCRDNCEIILHHWRREKEYPSEQALYIKR